jgi:Rod binding domain-containing protein
MANALDGLGIGSYGTYGAGATAAFGNRRDEQAANKLEAMRQGRAGASGGEEQLEKKVRGVAEEFVSVFMNQIMKSMRSTVQENPAMHGDNGEKFFQEMLDTEQSKTLAAGSGYGLTDLIYESMMSSYRVRQEQTAGQAEAADQGNMDAFVAETDDVAVDAVGL